jgi:EAL domain-containing protein (putative c-di-GMP-specific phosphodiesterase class I)
MAHVSRTVREALAQNQLYCVFQPIVDLRRKVTFGYESLARSAAPEFPGPLQLLAAAVKEGYSGELGRELRAMSVTACPGFPLFLNIHPNEFDEGWLVRPDDPMSTHEHEVYLEITESVPISHYRFCHSVLREIRSKGMRLAVDDLGAGYSNLKYIADLAPDVVKLDRELISGMSRESRLFRLVKSIVELCRDQGARVVAEGIETGSELRAVIDAGAHYGQGYFLARPDRVPPSGDWRKLIDSV